MCKYCEKGKTMHHSKTEGDYTLTSELSIVNDKLVTEISAHRYTHTDEFYDSWGIECDGEFSDRKFIDKINYCPFCGKELISKYIPKMYIYIEQQKAADDFIQNDKSLESFLRRVRYSHRDSSSLYYYLELKIRDYIRDNLSHISGHTSLLELEFLTGVDKVTKSTYNKIKKALLNGTDVYIEIEDNFPKINEVIENFKQLTENIIIIGLENISFDKDRNKLNINV